MATILEGIMTSISEFLWIKIKVINISQRLKGQWIIWSIVFLPLYLLFQIYFQSRKRERWLSRSCSSDWITGQARFFFQGIGALSMTCFLHSTLEEIKGQVDKDACNRRFSLVHIRLSEWSDASYFTSRPDGMFQSGKRHSHVIHFVRTITKKLPSMNRSASKHIHLKMRGKCSENVQTQLLSNEKR